MGYWPRGILATRDTHGQPEGDEAEGDEGAGAVHLDEQLVTLLHGQAHLVEEDYAGEQDDNERQGDEHDGAPSGWGSTEVGLVSNGYIIA